jgi:hypothetical protein
MKLDSEKKYCVYLHITKDVNAIFYVGIGDKDRPKNTDDRSDFWRKVVAKYGYNIQIICKNISWKLACQMEIALIKKYGRRDRNKGTLVNHTDGGDGVAGTIAWNRGLTKETDDRIMKYSMKIKGVKKNYEPWNKGLTKDNDSRILSRVVTEEEKLIHSIRMKENNPMKNLEIVEKSKKSWTLERRIKQSKEHSGKNSPMKREENREKLRGDKNPMSKLNRERRKLENISN